MSSISSKHSLMFLSKFIDGSFLLFIKFFRDGKEILKPECLGHFISCWCSLHCNGLDRNGNIVAGLLTEVTVEFPIWRKITLNHCQVCFYCGNMIDWSYHHMDFTLVGGGVKPICNLCVEGDSSVNSVGRLYSKPLKFIVKFLSKLHTSCQILQDIYTFRWDNIMRQTYFIKTLHQA